HPILASAADQIRSYFAGELQKFDLGLAPEGTEFQKQVWSELTRIPFGETISYGELSKRVAGDISASRAVGAANGQNPISIVVPCHRVIGSNGSLTGFGGGLQRKADLLGLERAVLFGETGAEYWASVGRPFAL
ncbi:MAG TPA: methylated-DNA--[protein]-cysteine S-methyltransferase, partial [Fimbriimonas sp.]|nr:methylated-DNA--[protein]-cysteine S-methyltransferase [Fimbriimonas sp.]